MFVRRKKGKKGQIFALFLVIMVIAIISFAIWLFLTQKKEMEEKITLPLKLSELYEKAARYDYFIKKAAKISAELAYSKILENAEFIDEKCIFENDYVEFCNLAKEKKFFPYFNEIFEEIGKNYFVEKITYFENNSVHIEYSYPLEIMEEEFYASYKKNVSFSIPLETLGIDLNFEKMFEEAKKCRKECAFENFDFEKKEKDGKIFFDLKTKKVFVINGEAKKIKTKFFLR